MRIFKAFSHTKTLPMGRFNFSNPTNSKLPTVVINVTKPSRIVINHVNQPKSTRGKENIDLHDLTQHELQQLIDFVV